MPPTVFPHAHGLQDSIKAAQDLAKTTKGLDLKDVEAQLEGMLEDTGRSH